MKTALKILTALAAVAGIVYILATYGDKLVAWAKKLLPSCEPEVEVEVVTESKDAPSEEVLAEEDSTIEEVIVGEAAPVAEDSDFEA